MANLGDMNVGDIVKIKENGVDTNFIIVHKGLPSDMYDESCDGVWLFREQTLSSNAPYLLNARRVDADNLNDYENSDANIFLNENYINYIDEKIRAKIKKVKIPFKKGTGNSNLAVQSGKDGLPVQVFLLSYLEQGGATSSSLIDGTKLNYSHFHDAGVGVSNKYYFTRTPEINTTNFFLTGSNKNSGSHMPANGKYTSSSSYGEVYIDPAFILPYDITVDADGTLSTDTNSPPTITSDKTGNLGTLVDGFMCYYSVSDGDEADELTVTLTMNDNQVEQFAAAKGEQYTYTLSGIDWLKTPNGEHTFKISVTDSKDTTEEVIVFSRDCKSATVQYETPLESNDRISACSLKIEGEIPEDAVCKYEVTNNAKDALPAWEDCTERVKAGLGYIFTNKIAENGFAFNFRVSVSRGESDVGGYITKISGGFE